MKRVTGYLVLVVSFIMIIFLSIDQPCMLDIIPDSTIVEGADNQEPDDQNESNSPENEDPLPSENPGTNETDPDSQKTGTGASRIYNILGKSNNLSEEQAKKHE
ncbi:hypothetical protein [Syntrophaceticus schinkii]|uniref:Uncharacterized protein n=1 Tax=Syntrophaceticus schinkii TaxID=499207 RepID=A0A0B7MPD3_9FIRM|nr:hypothetical protein [Syntrophaceticus schinkii]CEO89856.1 hypothetical protein SSCH_620006 [Syntrophaceticus schinkii]